MNRSKAQFLSTNGCYKAVQTLYDYLSFVLFLVFVVICFVIGRPLNLLDKILKTQMVDHLIRFFEFFAR